MGTRADFYIARDDGLEWIGSTAWDGYPDGVAENILEATTGEVFQAAFDAEAKERDDATFAQRGWPWPWNDSRTTDFAYVLIEGEGVVFSSFGGDAYWAARRGDDGDHARATVKLAFPDMSSRKNVAGGERSGVIVVQA